MDYLLNSERKDNGIGVLMQGFKPYYKWTTF